MHPHLFSAITLSLMIIAITLIHCPTSLRAEDEQYLNCSAPLNCSGFTDLGYPFWGLNRPESCGHPSFQLDCSNDAPRINISNINYKVLEVNKTFQTLRVARTDYWETICPSVLVNTTIDFTLFSYTTSDTNLTLYYQCPLPAVPITTLISTSVLQFNCTINNTYFFNYYSPNIYSPDLSSISNSIGACNYWVNVPIQLPTAMALIPTTQYAVTAAIDGGFMLTWNARNPQCETCVGAGGLCGSDPSTNAFACHCQNGTFVSGCARPLSSSNQNLKVSLGVGLGIAGAAIAGIFLGFLVFSIRKRKKRHAQESKSKDLPTPPSSTVGPASSSNFARSIPSYPYTKSDLEKGSTYFGAQIFSYDELEEATNNFDTSRELGDGGFGTVYYGKLHDGRVVAVKRLYENNLKRVEQFMNEVEILTKIRHKNLVTLYGCTSKRSQELLLVYEYIPNGTVADHLHGNRSKSGLLTWPVRLSIAIESAEALAYLHLSDVIHRDVKTNNILLDEKFQVKVADFGLSRLFPTDVTHVSTAPQGTPGYVDPEYYQCYQLTDKSDVYSFGVVLIELISSLPAVDTNRHRHDINLANMAVNKIQNHALHELVDPLIGFEKDYNVKRMTTSVAELAFRCLQQERDMRPSMDEVLEILRGIQNEEIGAQKAEVVDIRAADDVGLLKNIPPPLSPDTFVNDKWQMQDLRRTA
ncbi:LEAF RUST 10 DISEASE-RESISTANCE LOCUS RECEPTOR-LIKE PROTEIN KINASE-like 1.4 isoform X2 [Quercus suber]|uniref:LEAF RUST 10 DISEASE-RESISTANCE LOCUS RECEPTOR-LIKE PROTEIN KINASE-like 1.4 isoform X2 n=1 Tax=Quercus suber TaxID=58331 RepID=UPI000CE2393F|nr:LEAF RUST 10 DISEASE-RESISTANCE LOCUS RECEPTOR-LIKE PROTEIN KINASE-like 1.4 isoform X2 [Quercus suber]POF20741.1 leaf rust 10 disease-resistance locus receptor-like protein kinase-like 1.3 [Quercus suber]